MRDKILEVQLAFWTALLAVEGFVVTVAAIFAVFLSDPFSRAIIALVALLAAASGVALIGNFIRTRDLYLKIGSVMEGVLPARGQADISTGETVKNSNATSENIAVGILVAQYLLIGFMFLSVFAPFQPLPLHVRKAMPSHRQPEFRRPNPSTSVGTLTPTP